MPKTFTVKEVADILGFSTNSIYTFLKEKRIEGVRMGKGRFRIPEEELRRILHLSKKPIESVTSLGPTASESETATLPVSIGRDLSTHRAKILLPNIFDWFVGLSVITAGVALFLFNSLFAEPTAASLAWGLGAMRIILIAAGLGLILSAIGERSGRWHRVFHMVLLLIGTANGFILFRLGDYDGALLYGLLALVTGLTGVWHVGGIFGFGIYVSLLSIAAPLVILLGASSPHVQQASRLLSLTPGWLGIIAIAGSIGYLSIFWSGFVGARFLFWLACIAGSSIFFVLAILYGELQLWSRAFFVLVIGFFQGMLPSWWWISESIVRRGRMVVHGIFGAIGAVILSCVVVVGFLQQGFWQQREAEFSNKIAVATNIISSAVEAVKSSTVVASKNPDVVSAVVKKDTAELTRLSKIIYEANPDLRRIVYLNKNGDGLTLYPYGTFDQPNYSFREYFTQARDSGKPYLSNLFQALGDHSGRYVIVVANPIKEADGSFVGVMVSSIDIDRLAVKLGQVSLEERGEYFTVTDETGKLLFSSQQGKVTIGSDVSRDETVSRALAGESGVVGRTLPDGTFGMVAFEKVPIFGWTVTLSAPAQKIFSLSLNTTVTIVGAIILLMVVSLWGFIFIHLRGGILMQGGP